MTFNEALERLRGQDEYLSGHEDNITLPMAEQIEANRLAIHELRNIIQDLVSKDDLKKAERLGCTPHSLS